MGNLTRKKIAEDVFEFNTIRAIIYAVSWVWKILSWLVIWHAASRGSIGKLGCYFVSASQKVHMISVNSIALDLIPYGIRTLFHLKSAQLTT